tara:strand:- start:4499 stop:7894 length:3396 start_codon:yes stop_codon:yes gene_type:complete
MIYRCNNCEKEFTQKSHYDTHINKKKMCRKCPIKFETQYAFINEECIHIINYDKNIHKKPKCNNGHELIFCNGDQRKAYFKHKNANDVTIYPEMTEWHCKWQGNFPNIEVQFKKTDEKQIKNRRTDVLLNDKYILEIQHSKIEDSEVICRSKDYKLHNKEIIWLIDGNTPDIILDKLTDNTYLIEFKNNWKYKSFTYEYDFILLDINEKIFKIPVKCVCNKMFHAKTYTNIDIVIETLQNNPEKIWDLWEDINEEKPYLKIKQQGAGNGKTYGIWESISLNKDKNLFIITTKQHTAKEVILKELNDQAERNEYHIIDNMEHLDKEIYGRQYIITYKHKHSNRECIVIIGTIDSFIFSLTSKSIDGNNYFEGLLNNIYKNGCDKINKETGEITYAGRKLKLNKWVELWIDESQDLQEIYYKAIIILILNTKIGCVIVGDELQSLTYEENVMNCIKEDFNINFIKEEAKNINRRIKVKKMAEKINELVNFKKYNLPEIIVNDEELNEREDVIEIIKQEIIYSDDTDKSKVESEADKIIELVNKEVEEYNYEPKDFLFIFPIMKGNTLAGELETKLNEFWLKKYTDNNIDYHQYAVLHKHEEGQIIDTSKSTDASRIMSIRSSKGDGRKVVFILNCTEALLKMVSNNEKNIMYESHFHVALTRAIDKMYFGLQTNNDDIHKRFANIYEYVEYIPKISKKLTIDQISTYINKENIMKELSKYIDPLKEQENTNTNTNIIDWEYHCIGRSVYYNYALFEIFKYNNENDLFKNSQIKTVLDIISKKNIIKLKPKKFYKYININIDSDLNEIPLCDFSHKPIYQEYCNKIIAIIKYIQRKYKKDCLSIGNLSPLESTILIYVIDIFQNKKFHEITPSNIYNIYNSFQKENEIEKLIKESKKMKNIMKDLMEKIFEKDNIIWNIEHLIHYNTNIESIKLYNRFNIIGHNKYTVSHIIFQTDFNVLNYWDTIIKIILERFLIKNANSNENEINNKSRFSNKEIVTYLLVLKKNKYEIFNWDFEDKISDELKIICKDAFIKYFSNYNKELFNYCKCIKNNKDKWEGFKSPYQFISKYMEKYPVYIINFFNYLHNEMNKGNHKKVKEITDSLDLFNDEINYYINDTCETYFGLCINDDTIEY